MIGKFLLKITVTFLLTIPISWQVPPLGQIFLKLRKNLYPKSECAGALAGALVVVEVVLVVRAERRNIRNVAGAVLIDGLLAVPADEARLTRVKNLMQT